MRDVRAHRKRTSCGCSELAGIRVCSTSFTKVVRWRGFTFYEIFVSQSDFESHNATPDVQAWFDRLPEGGVKVVRMEVLGNRSAPPR